MMENGAGMTTAALGSSGGEEACGLFGELFRKLEVRAVPGIRIEDQPRIRQMLLKDVAPQVRQGAPSLD
jgi:hypothetical protein